MRPRIHKVVELTGTPRPNSLLDLWAQIYLLDQGERLGRYITHYRKNYFWPTEYSYEPGTVPPRRWRAASRTSS